MNQIAGKCDCKEILIPNTFDGSPERPLLGLRKSIFWAYRQKTLFRDGGHSGNDPQLVPNFHSSFFRYVSGTILESVRTCVFKSNSSNLDRAPRMRDFVLLNSWDSFLVTLSAISSETCAIYSSLILGMDVFRDWPFLGCSSCVSLVMAANFCLFLNVAIFWREKATQLWRLNYLYLLIKLRL